MKRSLIKALLFVSITGLAGTAMAADGGSIYASKCVACHGADGAGTAMGTAFKGNDFIKTGAEADIAAVITSGRVGTAKKYKQFAMGMPAQKLSDEEVKSLVAHLKALASR